MKAMGWALLLTAVLIGAGFRPDCPMAHHLVIVVDQSGSMVRDFDPGGLRWSFAQEILSALRSHPGRASIFAFGSSLKPLVRDVPLSEAQIPGQPPELGWSDLVGVFQALIAGYPEAACGAWVLITDGVPQTGGQQDPQGHRADLEKAIRRARSLGIPILVVLIAPPEIWGWTAFRDMRAFWIAREEEGLRVLMVAGDQDLPIAAQRALAILRSWWTGTPPPPTPSSTPTPTPIVISTPIPGAVTPTAAPSKTGRGGGGPVALGGALGGLAVLGGFLLWRGARRPPRLHGELVWFPQGEEERRVDLSRFRGAVGLERLDRALPRGAARLEPGKDPSGQAMIYLVPLRPGRVRYQGAFISEPVPLHDGDRFEVDGWVLRFEDLTEQIRRLEWRFTP